MKILCISILLLLTGCGSLCHAPDPCYLGQECTYFCSNLDKS